MPSSPICLSLLLSLGGNWLIGGNFNCDEHIDPQRIIARVQYEHPIYSQNAVMAQNRQAELNADRTYFCGAYWRNGFHEDGVVSALSAVGHFEERLANAELYLRRAG